MPCGELLDVFLNHNIKIVVFVNGFVVRRGVEWLRSNIVVDTIGVDDIPIVG